MIKGYVQAISQKKIKTRRGMSTKYGVLIDENWYDLGFSQPVFGKGDYVSFDVVTNDRGYEEIDESTVALETPPKAKAPKRTRTGGSAGGSKDDYWKAKDEYDKSVRQPLIMYQNATDKAVQIAIAALTNGILPTTGAKKADKFEGFMLIVDEIRDGIYQNYVEKARSLELGEEVTPSSKDDDDEVIEGEVVEEEEEDVGW